jgi:hypothetical protein
MCKTLITAEEAVHTITTPSSPMTLEGHLYEEIEGQADSITSETTLPTTSSSLESSPSFHGTHHPPRRVSNVSKNITGAVWPKPHRAKVARNFLPTHYVTVCVFAHQPWWGPSIQAILRHEGRLFSWRCTEISNIALFLLCNRLLLLVLIFASGLQCLDWITRHKFLSYTYRAFILPSSPCFYDCLKCSQHCFQYLTYNSKICSRFPHSLT